MPRRDEPFRLCRVDTGTPVVDVLHVASTIWSRFRGLQLRRSLPSGHGLLMVPCNSIHTMFVRFAIDVLFLSEEGIVTEVSRDVHPWRVVLPHGASAHAVLEMAAGSPTVEPGTAIAIDSGGGAVPAQLRFLAGEREAPSLENGPC